MIKKAIDVLMTLVKGKRIKERIKDNLSLVVADDEVVIDVLFGYDESTSVFIVLTNRHLYVLGDYLIHKVKKADIIDIFEDKGIISKLVELQCVEESIFFKVYTSRALAKIKSWVK